MQTLIALGQRLQMIQRTLERDPQRAGARLAELRVMAGEAVDEVRRFSRALRPVYLEELGLAPALEMLAHESGAHFQGRGQARRLSPEQEGALFRIAQEALSNATRHAQTTHLQIRLEFDEQRVSLHVQDDGVGFALPDHFHDLTRNGHFGLVGMVERAQIVGGRLTIASKPGDGTTVSVTLSA
ncbi:MAG: sensor histidine kinase [Acidimicrobiia bacterium]|nr:sensor histidine kinase [Acidimicrobiia bacterium]